LNESFKDKEGDVALAVLIMEGKPFAFATETSTYDSMKQPVALSALTKSVSPQASHLRNWASVWTRLLGFACAECSVCLDAGAIKLYPLTPLCLEQTYSR
jgi:hypothetical protein